MTGSNNANLVASIVPDSSSALASQPLMPGSEGATMTCPACHTPILAGARFCATCGVTLNSTTHPRITQHPTSDPPRAAALPAMSAVELAMAAKLVKLRLIAERLIDDFLRERGVPDPVALTDEQGRRCFTYGSARCRASIVEDAGELYLHVDAFVLSLPSDKELIVPLMRELLELNLVLRGAVRLGIADEAVIALSIRPLMELQREEFVRNIESVMLVADELDDTLLAKYGGTTKQRRSRKHDATDRRP